MISGYTARSRQDLGKISARSRQDLGGGRLSTTSSIGAGCKGWPERSCAFLEPALPPDGANSLGLRQGWLWNPSRPEGLSLRAASARATKEADFKDRGPVGTPMGQGFGHKRACAMPDWVFRLCWPVRIS